MKREMLTVAGRRDLNESVYELVLEGASPMRAGSSSKLRRTAFICAVP